MVAYGLDLSEEAVRRNYDRDRLPMEDEMPKWPNKSPRWVIEQASTEELSKLSRESPIGVSVIPIGIGIDAWTGNLRGFFEFVLPILVGLFGIGALLLRIFSV